MRVLPFNCVISRYHKEFQMKRNTILRLSPLAAALAVALSAPMAQAAAPAPGVLPGGFITNDSTITYTTTGTSQAAINLGAAKKYEVLQWGGTTAGGVTASVNAPTGITTVSGFNIGAGAALTINGNSAAAVAGSQSALILDLTGQPSNVYGTLNASAATATNAPTLFVANPNGIVVGSSATITEPAAATQGITLLGYAQDPTVFGGSVAVNSSTITHNGDVSVMPGATINAAAGYLLVAGAGNVNMGIGTNGSLTTIGVAAGTNVSAAAAPTSVLVGTTAYFTTAVLNLNSGTANTVLNTANTSIAAAGNTNVLSGANVSLGSVATLTGTFTNNGTVNVVASNGTINGGGANSAFVAGTIVNNGNMTASNAGAPVLMGATGGITNTGYLNASAAGVASALKLMTGTAAPAAISNSGQITDAGLTVSSASLFTNTGIINNGANPLNVTAGGINLGGVVQAAAGNSTIAGVTLAATSGGTGQINIGAALNAGANPITATAANQILVSNKLVSTDGIPNAINLQTNNAWTAPYSIGIAILPGGSLTDTAAASITMNVAASTGYNGNAIAYGNITAGGTAAGAAGFNFTGNSFYQGQNTAINVTTNTDYSSFTSDGVLTGGIVFGSSTPQPGNAYNNAVVFGNNNTVSLAPQQLGSAVQNTNLLGGGNFTVETTTPSVPAGILPNGTAVINSSFKTSNLFLRAAGGNLNLVENNPGTTPSTNDAFYWPGLMYLSTVQGGKLASIGTGQIDVQNHVFSNETAAIISNGVPLNSQAGGLGMYLMTNTLSGIASINTNFNSNLVLPNATLQVTGYLPGAPTGNVLIVGPDVAAGQGAGGPAPAPGGSAGESVGMPTDSPATPAQ
jgi:hypothetical protein